MEWLEDYLLRLKSSAFLVISHDRWFLDRVTTKTLEIEGGESRMLDGNWSRFHELKAEEIRQYEKNLREQQDFIRREREFIKKHMGSQRSKEAKGRLKRLERVERMEALKGSETLAAFRPSPKRKLGTKIIEIEDLAVGYDGEALFEGLSHRMEPGERLGIVGANGAGKSTLLEVLLGKKPSMTGSVVMGETVDLGYYDQLHRGLDRSHSPFDEIAATDLQRSDLEVRSYLARFLSAATKSIDRLMSSQAANGDDSCSPSCCSRARTFWCSTNPPTTSTSSRVRPSKTHSSTTTGR